MADAKIVSPPARPWDIDCSKDKGRTRKEFAKSCDVNVIYSRCVRHGVPLPSVETRAAFFDATGFGDFNEAMRRVVGAQDAFMKLSPEVRARFRNDVGQLIGFLQSPENRDEAVKLGLIDKPADEAPAPAPARGEPVVEKPAK